MVTLGFSDGKEEKNFYFLIFIFDYQQDRGRNIQTLQMFLLNSVLSYAAVKRLSVTYRFHLPTCEILMTKIEVPQFYISPFKVFFY
jgi:hypothetical protein